jgi:hypothetical protein
MFEQHKEYRTKNGRKVKCIGKNYFTAIEGDPYFFYTNNDGVRIHQMGSIITTQVESDKLHGWDIVL